MRYGFHRSLTLAVAVVALALAGCSSTEDEQPTYVEAPVDRLYNQAMDAMLEENYTQAAKMFEEVERQHPYSVWATKAQLTAAYAYYQEQRFDTAILTADRFIQLHPGNRDVAYAYYLKAISYYAQIADVSRDQRLTEQAQKALQEVIQRFPDSSYARDARVKFDLVRDHLAGKEMEIARYYMQRGHYGAAIRRFRMVIEQFQTTAHVPEALHRLTECYLAIGIPEEAQAAGAVLGHNFPGSDWYRYSYAMLTGAKLEPEPSEQSWITRAFRSIL